MICEEDDNMIAIIEAFQELQDDHLVPRNVKNKLSEIIVILKDECDMTLRINRALDELDQIANDSNLQSYTRTQIWNVASLLEMF